jgi:Tol biopolymer transport system component
MALTNGSRIGPYEIDSLVGAGGMGEVYRARDTRLDRDVALKILPDAFARDPERLSRFEREAKTLASLNHPHIAQIYGLEQSGDTTALVMELVEGEDLSRRIGRGRLPLDEALPIARQIAQALETAHERGIIHRDLKPANVKVRADGTVKVLDFGLAKLTAPAITEGTNSPSITSPAMTLGGVVLGTAAYMAPEQAKGKPVDRRADVWAFGCVLYEMLAGQHAFEGEDVSDTVASVLTREPDWSTLPAKTPPGIRRLLRRCLQKDPARRLRHAGDAAIEIDEATADSAGQDAAPPAILQRRERLVWAVALTIAVVVAASLAALLIVRPTSLAPEMRVEITTPPTTDPISLALSPDSQTIAFVATDTGRPRLWLRSLQSGAVWPLTGTDGASLPFWAPHGRSIGFFADDGRLKRIDLDGGAVRVLANAPLPRGGAWSRDDTILFVPFTGPIFRLSAAGGEPTAVTRLEPRQSSHNTPRFLPDGEHFVYYVTGAPEIRGVYVAALGASEGRRLVDADSIAVETSSGYLLFVRNGTLFAQPLDPARLEMRGSPLAVAESIALQPLTVFQAAAVSASLTGRIIYRSGSLLVQRQFVWFDRSGKEVGKVGSVDSAVPLSPAFSSNGRRLALNRTVDGNSDIWLLETERGGLSRFTSHPANDIQAIWSPDGSRILFSSNRSGSYQLYEKSTLGALEEKVILPIQSPPLDWSRDGRFLLFQTRDPNTGSDIWVLPFAAGQKPFPVVQTEFEERHGQFSPDGKWIAYESTESGRSEVYVQPFPGPGTRSPISINGGAQPRWRGDGKELFFIGFDERLMAVPISLPRNSGPAEAGPPIPLFVTHLGGAIQVTSRQQYLVSTDGSRFLMNTVLEGAAASSITLILNWRPRLMGASE